MLQTCNVFFSKNLQPQQHLWLFICGSVGIGEDLLVPDFWRFFLTLAHQWNMLKCNLGGCVHFSRNEGFIFRSSDADATKWRTTSTNWPRWCLNALRWEGNPINWPSSEWLCRTWRPSEDSSSRFAIWSHLFDHFVKVFHSTSLLLLSNKESVWGVRSQFGWFFHQKRVFHNVDHESEVRKRWQTTVRTGKCEHCSMQQGKVNVVLRNGVKAKK